MNIRIVHLSDFHLSSSNKEGAKTLTLRILKALCTIHQEKRIDLIIFTGDLVNKAGEGFDNLPTAFETFKDLVMKPITEALKMPLTRFIIVPGNHDTKIDKGFSYLKKGYLGDNPVNTQNDVVKMKCDDSCKNYIIPKIESFKKFEKEIYHKTTDIYKPTDFESNWIIKANDGTKIGITSLNSVWFCDLEDGFIFLGVDQISNSQPHLKEATIKIAASHYHFDKLQEAEKIPIKDMLACEYNLFLSGHVHSPNAEFRQESNSDHYFLDLTAAGTLLCNAFKVNPQYENSFYVVDIFSSNTFDIRKYRQCKGLDFKLDHNFGSKGVLHKTYNKFDVQAFEEWKARQEEDSKRTKFLEGILPFRPMPVAEKEGVFNKVMNGDFKITQYIKEIMQGLHNESKKLILITGISGVGKTRIIYEAYKDNDDVYYLPSSCNLNILSNLMIVTEHGVAVIDNAVKQDIINARRVLKNCNKPFRIVLIINSADKEGEPTREGEYLIDYEKSQAIVEAIIDDSDINEPEIKVKIKEYAGGIPLLAKELIEAYKSCGNINIMPDKDDCFTRIIDPKGKLDANSLNALYTIAAFNPFGYEDNGKKYFDFVVSHSIFHRITESKELATVCFEDVIKNFKEICLFDERAGGYIEVRAWPLLNWLSLKWFNMIPEESWPELIKIIESDDIGRMLAQHLSNRLKWLYREEAKALTDSLNKTSFHNEAVAFTQTGSELLSSMAVLNPESVAINVLSLLENKSYEYICTKISDKVRRNIVWTLTTCCGEAQSFEKAAKALALLAIGENESYGNNATGTFLQLFHIVLSGTEATLSAHSEVLRYLKEKGIEFYPLIVKAVDCAFETRSLHRMETPAERINGKINDNSVAADDLIKYWKDCIELLKDITASEDAMAEIRKLIPNHVYDLVSNNCMEELCDLFEFFAPRFNYDWIEMRKALHWVHAYKKSYYYLYQEMFNKMTDLLFPKNFKDAIDVAFYEMDRKAYDNDNIKVYLETMKPFAERFVKEKIWKKPDFAHMADDDNFCGMWLAESIFYYIDKYRYRGEFYKAIENYILTKPTEYRSQFLLSVITSDSNKASVKKILEKLLDKGYYNMASSLMGHVDDQHLLYFERLIKMVENHDCDSVMLQNYILFYRHHDWEHRFKIINRMYESDVVDKAITIHQLEPFGYGIKEKDYKKYLPNVEKMLLNYPFDKEHLNNDLSYIYLVKKILEKNNRQKFAKSLHNKIIKFLNINYIMIDPKIEQLYSALLPKYQNVILDDILNAIANPSKYFFYSFNVQYILGSKFNLGKGILFQCDEEKIKSACLKHKDTLPQWMARMCLVYNYDKSSRSCKLSDFALWLIESFGDDDKVLDNLGSNFGSYSHCGGSIVPFFEARRKAFEPLLRHKNPHIAKWAQRMYDRETCNIEREKDNDEYIQMLNRM